jgi:hypothetical protein
MEGDAKYADRAWAELSAAAGSSMFLLAGLYGRPVFAGYQKDHASGSAQDLIWYSQGITAKAGDNKFNHSHLDLGSFVIDAQGQRCSGPLGSDDYNLPGYFDTAKQRWTYYRLRAEGCNAFILDPGSGPDQDIKAAAVLSRVQSSADEASAVTDLTKAYALQATRVMRGMALIHGRKWFLIQDEAQTPAPAEAWWFMHTKAAIAVSADGANATLALGGKTMLARILSPMGANSL